MKRIAITCAAALAAAGAVGGAFAQDVAALLKAADKYRMSSENMQVETLISVFNADGSPDRERRYTVFAQARHQSLVLMRSPAEKGQKLLGDASTGDIATMSWAADYTGTVVGEEPCGEPNQPCLHLSLAAGRKGVSYQRIELWLGKTHHEPVQADLYVQSDKLAKQARFVTDKPAAPTTVTAMLLRDQLTNKKETQVRYLGRKEHTLPESWLNPMFLARNPALE